LLIDTGHRPNTTGMGLEGSSVQVGKHGENIFDETMPTPTLISMLLEMSPGAACLRI